MLVFYIFQLLIIKKAPFARCKVPVFDEKKVKKGVMVLYSASY